MMVVPFLFPPKVLSDAPGLLLKKGNPLVLDFSPLGSTTPLSQSSPVSIPQRLFPPVPNTPPTDAFFPSFLEEVPDWQDFPRRERTNCFPPPSHEYPFPDLDEESPLFFLILPFRDRSLPGEGLGTFPSVADFLKRIPLSQ